MSLMKLTSCTRCHKRLCYRTSICMACDAKATSELPAKLVEDVTSTPETYPLCDVCQEVHAHGQCPPAKTCWRGHGYYGQTCPTCQCIERGFQMLARNVLAVRPDEWTPGATHTRQPVPDAFYAAFEGCPAW